MRACDPRYESSDCLMVRVSICLDGKQLCRRFKHTFCKKKKKKKELLFFCYRSFLVIMDLRWRVVSRVLMQTSNTVLYSLRQPGAWKKCDIGKTSKVVAGKS